MTLTVSPPTGARFDSEEVKTAKGTQSLGDVPILVWEDLNAASTHYGVAGIIDMLDGTSPRVSFQGIARRMKAAGKTDDEIANAQIAFRPGKRTVGAETPKSKVRKAADAAAEKVGNPDLISALMAKISSGEISAADLASLTQ